jgi:hypothetical protein
LPRRLDCDRSRITVRWDIWNLSNQHWVFSITPGRNAEAAVDAKIKEEEKQWQKKFDASEGRKKTGDSDKEMLERLAAIGAQLTAVQHRLEAFESRGISEIVDAQMKVMAFHDAWLAQEAYLKRSRFPFRWMIAIGVAMILTWVFSHYEFHWR